MAGWGAGFVLLQVRADPWLFGVGGVTQTE